ncbi:MULTISPECIES: 50S ribosomal protein L33 [unclassified Streptomyces]
MARSSARPTVTLKSSAGTRVTYVTRKNCHNDPGRRSWSWVYGRKNAPR